MCSRIAYLKKEKRKKKKPLLKKSVQQNLKQDENKKKTLAGNCHFCKQKKKRVGGKKIQFQQ